MVKLLTWSGRAMVFPLYLAVAMLINLVKGVGIALGVAFIGFCIPPMSSGFYLIAMVIVAVSPLFGISSALRSYGNYLGDIRESEAKA